ncbi:hypothetical protein [Dyella silvae]|uniref:hypothetical protein n=1 Tax=Dyella silvae TaxID=2994424 RepID=UPI00226477E3|nr:hypothetical protein [Dyella silvae]
MPTSCARSMFVTALSWAFIGLGAIGTLFFLLFSMVSAAGLQAMAHGTTPVGASYRHMAQAMAQLPEPWPWIYAHAAELMLVAAALAFLHLVSALGLLWRKPWARRSFIGLMLLDIALQSFGVASALTMQPALQQAMREDFPPQLPPAFMEWMQRMMAFQQIEAIVRPVLLALVFGWIAWRLTRAPVREEFSAVRQ